MNKEQTSCRRIVGRFLVVACLSHLFCLGDASVDLDAAQIKALAQSADYKRLVEYVDAKGINWSNHPDTGHIDFLLGLSKEVVAFGASSEERNKFLLLVSENALEKDPPNGVRWSEILEKKAYFLFVMMNEAVFRETPKFREKRCQLVVSFLARINDIRDPNYVPKMIDRPFIILKGIPAEEIPDGSHVRPEAIKNEELRADYEKRIHEYEDEVEQNQLIVISNRIYRLLQKDVKKFFIRVFKDDPDGIDLIRHWMELGKFSESDIEEVIGAFPAEN